MMGDQAQAPYLDALARYRDAGYASFATPGHKRGQGAPDDLREVIGGDVLTVDAARAGGVEDTRESTGLIGAAERLAAEAYGADKSWFLVNGSTSGVHALVICLAGPGDHLVLSRNSHKSMLAALIMSGAVPHYIEPAILEDWCIPVAPSPGQLARALGECPQAKAVLMTSPTMYGVCADGVAMARVSHEAGVPFVVDQAWGPHLRFCSELPADAMTSGADACVVSVHKLISGLTQSSLLLARSGRIDLDRLGAVVLLTQTTSPQALIYASIDAARRQMVERGEDLLRAAVERANRARREIAALPGLSVLCETPGAGPPFELDPTRLTVSARDLGLSGYQLESVLRRDHRIVVEMSDPLNVVCNVTLGDSEVDLTRLIEAMTRISERAWHDRPQRVSRRRDTGLALPRFTVQVLSPRDAFFSESVAVPTRDAEGEVSAEMVTPYPPGVPVLGPGEEISGETVTYLLAAAETGLHVHGPQDESLGTIRVVK